MLGLNGGLIGVRRTPSIGAAVGVWTLNEQVINQRLTQWPTTNDPFFSSVSLLLHMDGSNGSTAITDSSSAAVAVTANNGAAISTAESKFDGASLYLNGSTQSLTFNDPQLGTGDFTIELWLKTSSSVQYAQIIGNETSGGVSGYSFMVNNNSASGGQLAVYVAGTLVVSSATGDWSDDQWHHIALTRSGNTLTLWTDGNSNGVGGSSASFNGTTVAYVGRNSIFSPRNLIGYIDDFRITKGVARYASSFAPPIAPFPNA